MIIFNDEYRRRDRELFRTIGERIPSRLIPKSMSNEEIYAIVDESIKSGKNLFPQKLGYGELPDTTIY